MSGTSEENEGQKADYEDSWPDVDIDNNNNP